MSWTGQNQMFNSFQARENKSRVQRMSHNKDFSRNNLKPIRTFGRDISNIQPTSHFMQDRLHTNSKPNKKIKLKYPNNSLSRRQFGFDMCRNSNKSSIRTSVADKRYISSSSLTDRNKKRQSGKTNPQS